MEFGVRKEDILLLFGEPLALRPQSHGRASVHLTMSVRDAVLTHGDGEGLALRRLNVRVSKVCASPTQSLS